MKRSNLPADILTTASVDGHEKAWAVQDFLSVLELARKHKLACLGGQFQFRFDDGTFEMFWLNADATDRKQSESWEQYVNRSIEEVSARFDLLCKTVDFEAETRKSTFISSKRLSGIELMNHLFFLAYFVSKDEEAVST